MRTQTLRTRPGYTLMELLVVISILALIAALAIPQLTNLLKWSETGVEVASIQDAAKYIEIYNARHRSYPDGWDTLLDTSQDLYGKLSPALLSGTFLAKHDLTDDQITSIRQAGVNHVNLHDDTLTNFPSDSGNTGKHLFSHSSGKEQATLVKLGADGVSYIASEMNLPSKVITENTFVVFGFGPKNWAVSEVVQSPPLMPGLDPSQHYSRALAIFAVPNAGTEPARFVGILAPDGRGLKTTLTKFYEKAPRDH